jgi:hypothetical protein
MKKVVNPNRASHIKRKNIRISLNLEAGATLTRARGNYR